MPRNAFDRNFKLQLNNAMDELLYNNNSLLYKYLIRQVIDFIPTVKRYKYIIAIFTLQVKAQFD